MREVRERRMQMCEWRGASGYQNKAMAGGEAGKETGKMPHVNSKMLERDGPWSEREGKKQTNR